VIQTSLIDTRLRPRAPSFWPARLQPESLTELQYPTPFLVCDLQVVRERYRRLMRALPQLSCFYAAKCNSDARVVRVLAEEGSSFEIASAGELDLLLDVGVPAPEVLYSNTVKPASHIAAAHQAGVWRFAFDGEGELHKLARHAPGCAVYVRLRVDDSASVFPLSRKFGAELHQARALLLLARDLGLHPYGVTFHVGSQCTTAVAWLQAIAAVGRLLERLQGDGITLAMLNVGGGFPAQYADPIPPIEQIATTITASVDDLLPYRPELLAAEPGRYLVAESSVLATSVLARELRAGEEWLYVDVSAYHGLMETQQTAGQWRFPLWTSRADHGGAPQVAFTVTGPSCDSSDTMFYGVALPSTLTVGDRLYVGSAGAYTLSYASHFNGFPPPAAYHLDGR
jgi:ornithine decarboxylase